MNQPKDTVLARRAIMRRALCVPPPPHVTLDNIKTYSAFCEYLTGVCGSSGSPGRALICPNQKQICLNKRLIYPSAKRICPDEALICDPRTDLSGTVWEEFGLTPPDTVRSPIPAPTGRPVFTLTPTKATRELLVEFHDSATGRKAIPYGCNGAVAAWKVGGPAPADQGELTSSKLLTTHRQALEFSEAERGQTVYLALCYQSERGQRGSWPEIQTAIVP